MAASKDFHNVLDRKSDEIIGLHCTVPDNALVANWMMDGITFTLEGLFEIFTMFIWSCLSVLSKTYADTDGLSVAIH